MNRMKRLFTLLKRIRRILAPIVIIVTIGLFAYAFIVDVKIRTALLHTNPLLLLFVLGLYFVSISCLVWVYSATLRLCGVTIDKKENFLLTCYSTIANFFGPLQSGPGVRAIYLKQKHGIKIQSYTLASLVYYAMFAIISALFLLIGSGRHWPLATAILVIVCLICLIVIRVGYKIITKRGGHLQLSTRSLLGLLVATFFQLLMIAVIFFVELHAVGERASVLQTIAYAGASNFALFVSLTPGALGIREAFLAFSISIHGIPTAYMLAMSTIDRAIYLVFLGLLFLLCLGTHAADRVIAATSSGQKLK